MINVICKVGNNMSPLSENDTHGNFNKNSNDLLWPKNDDIYANVTATYQTNNLSKILYQNCNFTIHAIDTNYNYMDKYYLVKEEIESHMEEGEEYLIKNTPYKVYFSWLYPKNLIIKADSHTKLRAKFINVISANNYNYYIFKVNISKNCDQSYLLKIFSIFCPVLFRHLIYAKKDVREYYDKLDLQMSSSFKEILSPAWKTIMARNDDQDSTFSLI